MIEKVCRDNLNKQNMNEFEQLNWKISIFELKRFAIQPYKQNRFQKVSWEIYIYKVERFVQIGLLDFLSRGLRSMVWPYLALMRPFFYHINIRLCDLGQPTNLGRVGDQPKDGHPPRSHKWIFLWWKDGLIRARNGLTIDCNPLDRKSSDHS